MHEILICEDDLYLSNIVEKAIHQKLKITPSKIHSFEEAKKINKKFSIILLDINLPDGSGLDLVSHFLRINPNSKIIMMTAEKSFDSVIECMRLGAYNYIPKPFKLAEITSAVQECFNYKEKSDKVEHVSIPTAVNTKNKKLLTAYSIIDKVKDKPVNIHIHGESGTGKEIYTKALAKARNKKIVSVNCPAIPANLAESELFGHVKGAFTGAESDRIGKFEQANGGILFLDEIGDLSSEIQAKILRILQEREIERVGSNKKISLDIQLVSASSKNLKDEISNDNFRLDLFYRLSDIEVELPPLRHRTEDMQDLCNFFFQEFSEEFECEQKSLNTEAMKILSQYQWPGNIRELRSIIRRISILSDEQVIRAQDIPDHLKSKNNIVSINSAKLSNNEKDFILEVLEKNDQNISVSAKELGIGRTTLYRKLKKYNIPTNE